MSGREYWSLRGIAELTESTVARIGSDFYEKQISVLLFLSHGLSSVRTYEYEYDRTSMLLAGWLALSLQKKRGRNRGAKLEFSADCASSWTEDASSTGAYVRTPNPDGSKIIMKYKARLQGNRGKISLTD